MKLPWQRHTDTHAEAPQAAPARGSFGGFGPGSAVIPIASIAESATSAGVGLITTAAGRAELTVRNAAGREIEHALLEALATPDGRRFGNGGQFLAAMVRAAYVDGYSVARARRSGGRIFEIVGMPGAYFRRGVVYSRSGWALPPGDTAVFALGREIDGTPNTDHLAAIRNAATLSQSAEWAMGRALRSGGMSAIVRKRDPQAPVRQGAPTDAQIQRAGDEALMDRDTGGPTVSQAPGAGPVPLIEIDMAESIDVIKLDAQQIAVMGAAADARRRVANALGIPAQLISGEAAGGDLEAAWSLFGRTVLPRIASMIEAAFAPLLGTGERLRVRAQSMELGAADQVATLLNLRQSHILSVNDVLRDLHRPTIGESWADDPRLIANPHQPLRGDPTGAAGGE